MKLTSLLLCALVFTLNSYVVRASTAESVHSKISKCSKLKTLVEGRNKNGVIKTERIWIKAELRGNTDVLSCILEPNYTEILMPGSVHDRADLLKGAAKMKGNTKPIPVIKWTSIVIDGDSAVSYSIQNKHDMQGNPVKLFFTDTFIYRKGFWRPYFSVNAKAAPNLKTAD